MRIKPFGILAASALLLLLGGQARASHKSWFMKHGGAECSFVNGAVNTFFGGDGGNMFLYNNASLNRSAVCPIGAAGRWGSSGTRSFGPARWAEAKKAYVHVYNGNPNTSFTCQAVARLRVALAPGGSLYYGTARSVTGVGNHTIQLIQTTNGWQSWGGALETNEQARVRSLDFQCTVPGNQDFNFNSSYIRGYGAATCQFGADCNDGFSDSDDSKETEIYIQGNGANCTSSAAGVFRGADGLASTQNTPFGQAVAVCPIVPPTQDSYEHPGHLKEVRLYYSGTGSAGCEQAQTCPQCRLQWEERDTGNYRESLMFTWNSGGYMAMPTTPNGTSDPSNMKIESGAAIRCHLPIQHRIRGYTARTSQTRQSIGQ